MATGRARGQRMELMPIVLPVRAMSVKPKASGCMLSPQDSIATASLAYEERSHDIGLIGSRWVASRSLPFMTCPPHDV